MTTTTGVVIPEFTVGDRLRKARELTGLDQQRFADEIGISRQSVSNYELGNTKVRKIVLIAWQMRTGVPVEWLEHGRLTQPPVQPSRLVPFSSPIPGNLDDDSHETSVWAGDTRSQLAATDGSSAMGVRNATGAFVRSAYDGRPRGARTPPTPAQPPTTAELKSVLRKRIPLQAPTRDDAKRRESGSAPVEPVPGGPPWPEYGSLSSRLQVTARRAVPRLGAPGSKRIPLTPPVHEPRMRAAVAM
jgi:transcriptional regulator with XRE-family HTH domain